MARYRHCRGKRRGEPLLRAADRDPGRSFRQDSCHQREERAVARRHDPSRHGRARRRQLHRRRLDRRADRQHRDRRLRHFQGRRPSPGAQSRGGMGAEGHSRQRDSSRAGQDRVRPRAVGGREAAQRAHPGDASAAARRAARYRRHRGVPRLRRRGVHHRAVHRRRRRVYHSVVTGYIRAMDLNYSVEEVDFRDAVRTWLSENLPRDLKDKVDRYEHLSKEDLLRWHRILAGKGWVAPAWPKEWGGTGWNVVQRYIFEEELGYVGAPPLIPFGLAMCAPVLLQFGTDAQKKRFLPRIYQGEDFWCQGYSEPGSGSDLASLKTRAVRQDGHYVVTGQKIWTTMAQHADWIFCLVRTDASGKRQDGISFLLIDMRTPGITVRPIVLLDGSKEVNEVFFDEVKVPAENLVHEEGKGWTVAKYLLGYERMGTGRIGASKRELAKLKEVASEQMKDGRPILDDPRFRDRLTRVEVELMALEITNMRFLDQLRGGRAPGAEVSLLKIKGTEIQQAITELMMQTAGPFAQAFRPVNGESGIDRLTAALVPRYCNVRKATIYAGSNEIQRNIIAKATLGL